MIPDVKLQQLRYFVLVAELKSYHAAAERAARTQPALSLAIRELEQRLGEALFERGNKTELTPFGRQCYPEAKALLDHYHRVVEQMAMAADSQMGHVSIACVPSFAAYILPRALRQFSEQYPEVRVSIEDDTAYHVQQRVADRHVDFGVSSLWSADSEIAFEPLLTDEMGLVCRRDHFLAQEPGPLSWADLEGHTLIANGTMRLLAGTPAERIPDEARLSVPNLISLLATLRTGLGVTALPRLALDERDPDLTFIRLREPFVERQLGLLTPNRRTLSPAAKALHACILEATVALAPQSATAAATDAGESSELAARLAGTGN